MNEITINGITPTADESSIEFKGTGAEVITDMTIDLEENPEHFDDTYPSEIEELSSSESANSSESDEETEAVKALTFQIRKVSAVIREATEERSSAQGRLNMSDNDARSLITNRPRDLVAFVDAYQDQRAKAFESHNHHVCKLEEHEEQMKRLKDKTRKINVTYSLQDFMTCH